MSLERTDTVDAVTVRDGWAVLSIHHFEAWEAPDAQVELLRLKLDTYFEHVRDARYLAAFHQLPARIELVCRDAPPELVLALCARFGVAVLA